MLKYRVELHFQYLMFKNKVKLQFQNFQYNVTPLLGNQKLIESLFL